MAFHAFPQHYQSLRYHLPQLWDGEMKAEATVPPLITAVFYEQQKKVLGGGNKKVSFLCFLSLCCFMVCTSASEMLEEREEARTRDGFCLNPPPSDLNFCS